jgi:hypothetical protein
MIWGGFSGSNIRSSLVVMTQDPESGRGGYSAESYIQPLEEGLLPIYDGELMFQQDNASIHTAHIVKKWLEDHVVDVLDWPSFFSGSEPN